MCVIWSARCKFSKRIARFWSQPVHLPTNHNLKRAGSGLNLWDDRILLQRIDEAERLRAT